MAVVAVLGAGNGGQASAADLWLRGHEVRLFSRNPETLRPVLAAGGIQIDGALGEEFAAIDLVTADLAEAVLGADVVELVVPTPAIAYYGAALASIIKEGQVVFLNPGHTGGGLHLVRELRRAGYQRDIRTCEVASLTYACRQPGPAQVTVFSVARNLPFAAFPGRHASELFEVVSELYPSIQMAESVLETALHNLNAVEHPPQMILNAGWIESSGGDYYFYREGTTPAVGRVIDAVDAERLALAGALGVKTKSFVDLFCELGYTSPQAAATGSAYAALQESKPNWWIKAPNSVDHRYLHEDVGQGLVPWAALGDLLGVDTPTMDDLIVLGSVVGQHDYSRVGLTLERLGIDGVPAEELDAFLDTGTRS
ncbi:MAG TPA: NAD/NADP octopine/nopaline dehydrogenase family protein [Solirubrobacteraceae bacterium]|jgi:opine dehydrogenase|nr:NAD/NADP octopine/nopaline dehydrogenase family protein [Solirubrobacteraceae bacterium]